MWWGAVIVREADGSFSKTLVHLRRPLLRIPNLCIHLTTAEERGKFAPNKETHLQASAREPTPLLPSRHPLAHRSALSRAPASPPPRSLAPPAPQPILGLINAAVNEPAAAPAADADSAPRAASGMEAKHAPELLRALADELGCEVAAIMDFELTLCDTQPSAIWGLSNELLSAPRLDNLMHCFTALRALVDHAARAPASAPDVSLIALFDHEVTPSSTDAAQR